VNCTSPLQVWRSKDGDRPNGRLRLVFHEENGIPNTEMYIPCGQCVRCRLEKSRIWAIRCVKEAEQYEKNCFITLTYRPEEEPENNSLVKEHFQLFMKRLRKKYGSKIRFYACGEYGERYERPHYHACLFNHDFTDKTLWSIRENISLYRSQSLEKLWPKGYCTIGEVTFDSAAYVARYIMKKITGEEALNHYGEKVPEFTNMSRRPGIGRAFFEKFHSDIYSLDALITNKNEKILKLRPPKYYDKLYENLNPERMKQIKEVRQAKNKPEELQGYRLRCKARIDKRKLKQLKRGYENEQENHICDLRQESTILPSSVL